MHRTLTRCELYSKLLFPSCSRVRASTTYVLTCPLVYVDAVQESKGRSCVSAASTGCDYLACIRCCIFWFRSHFPFCKVRRTSYGKS